MNQNPLSQLRDKILGKVCLLGLLITGLCSQAQSQEYFQQKVNYKIQVRLDDKRHELNAFERLEYINKSPDSLGFLYFHLWPNAYSDNHTDLARQLAHSHGKEKLFDDPELNGSIDSLDFKVNDLQVQWKLLPGQPDICQLILNQPLQPGDTLQITTPFRVKLPKGVTSRLGHIGESYQISQWYPKPAVYDQGGWHQMPYLDQGEFYSEFGDFDVSIILPSNYTVGATGNLQNEQETERLTKLAADHTWISHLGKVDSSFPASSDQMKTLRYTQSQVHDFAWFADKRFHVIKGSVQLPGSGRTITTWAMFTDLEANLWVNANTYENRAISYFSQLVGEYPYDNYTAVQSALNAGVGMEYPGITVIGLADNAYSLDEVITHEIAHTWFYSALGSNERRYPYLDESITSAYTARYMNDHYPGKKLWEVYMKKIKQARFFHVQNMPVKRIEEIEWLIPGRSNLEQPLNLAAPDYTEMNYGIMLYNKAATGFEYLKGYLGDSIFDASMQAYYQRWKFRHPQPNDLQSAFESHTEKDLKWFFNDFITTTKRLDYKVVRLENNRLLVQNNGELVAPLVIGGLIGDSICFEKWVDGFAGQQWIEIPQGNYSEIKIDPRHITPELFRLNNNIRKKGLFPKADPMHTQLIFTIEDPDKRTLMYIPAVNWNKENGFMVGMVFHNGFLITKPFEYFLMPFYSFNDSRLAGFGRISYNITPFNQFIRLATLSVEGTKFGAPANQDYYKLKTGFNLSFRNKNLNNPFRQQARGYYTTASDLFQIELPEKARMNSYLQFGYLLEKKTLINPFSVMASLETHHSYQKTSVEINYRYSYIGKNQGLDIRLFAGTMLKNTSSVPFYAFAPSGRSGREEYLYQGTYPNRFSVFPTTFWSRQMSLSEGGLVSPVNDRLGYSRWLVSASFTSNLPGRAGRMAVKPFANFLLNDHGLDQLHPSPLFFETGLKAGIWNFLEIYVPLLVSGNLESINGSFKNRIRFVFKLDSFNQFKLKQGAAN
ncbi:MAG TPA: M1 family metallopeptidase [Prolixibacteraceae bacterium]|jgi:hypothetical protein